MNATQRNGAAQSATVDFDAVVVGAGFAGMYMLYRLREIGLSVRVYEKGDGVGGTWYWNRYPGARCDVESLDYSYSFSPELEQEWEWSERFPSQPEILRYLNHVADRFELRPDIQLETTVEQAHYEEAGNRWLVRTSADEHVSARFCIMAAGCLTKVNAPDFQGLGSFEGDWYHTARWPQDGVDFSDRRVAVIGTGSTGIQLIPQVAKRAGHLYVMQRTPNFAVPARNGPLDAEAQAEVKASYRERRALARTTGNGLPRVPLARSALDFDDEECRRLFLESWERGGPGWMTTFTDLLLDAEANDKAAEFVRSQIRDKVDDPAVSERLLPTDHPIGTKRICIEIDYFETYNRDNVTLVDVRRSPIEEITPKGIRTFDAEYELDAIIFATGFDAMTGALLEIDIRGRDGLALREVWAEGPRSYLGLGVSGFPNLFVVAGPGSPSVLSNVVVSIEQHVEWISDCIAAMGERGLDRIEAEADAQEAWVEHVNEVADQTLFPTAASWYMGANIPGKPRIFMPYVGGVGNYRKRCEEVAADDYRGFRLSGVEAHAV